jgi:hypothetical protein
MSADSPHPSLIGTIPISHKDWADLAAERNGDFTLVSYGAKPGSPLILQLVVRRKSDGLTFIAETHEIFEYSIEWLGTVPFTRLYPAAARTIWEIP